MTWVNDVIQGIFLGGAYALTAVRAVAHVRRDAHGEPGPRRSGRVRGLPGHLPGPGRVRRCTAVGLSLMFGVMRLVNLAHGDLAVCGTYLATTVMAAFGVPLWVALLIMVPLAFLLRRGAPAQPVRPGAAQRPDRAAAGHVRPVGHHREPAAADLLGQHPRRARRATWTWPRRTWAAWCCPGWPCSSWSSRCVVIGGLSALLRTPPGAAGSAPPPTTWPSPGCRASGSGRCSRR